MRLRPLIFWPHLIAGVVAGAAILLMSVTGVLLTYERQLIAWSDRHLRSEVPADGAARLPVETLVQTFQREHPELRQPTTVTVTADPAGPVALAVPDKTVYLDAYSGRLLGESSQGVRRFMSDLRSWHRYLAVMGEARPVARAVTGWANLLFLFIVASGVYLWFPRRWTWQRVRPVVFFRGGLRGKARDFNWHNAIGWSTAIPLTIVVAGAVPTSFRWANDLVYRAVGEQPPGPAGRGAAGGRQAAQAAAAGQGRGERRLERPGEDRGEGRAAILSVDGLNALWARAEQQVPGWRTINLRLPASPRAPVVFAIDRGTGGQPQLRSTLTLDRRSGDVVSHETFSSLTLGRRIRGVLRFAHTGEVLGILGQTVAGLASAGAVVLVWTGVALALRRLLAWIKRRRASAEPAADDAAAA